MKAQATNAVHVYLYVIFENLLFHVYTCLKANKIFTVCFKCLLESKSLMELFQFINYF